MRLPVGGVLALSVVGGLLGAAPAEATAPAHPALGGGAPAEQSDPAAVAALQRAAEAERASGWVGTQYVAAFDGDSSASAVLLVRHVPGTGTVVVPAGGSGAAVTAPDQAGSSAPLAVSGLDGGALPLLEQSYGLALGACGGSRCVVVRRQDGSVAARLWVDPVTGVVGRRELYDASGHVVRASAFVDLRPDAGASATPALATEAAEQQLDTTALGSLQRHGWVVPRALPGGLVLFDAEEARAMDVLHLAYSDGLTQVSLFEQRGELDPRAVRGWRPERAGGTTTWWEGNGLEPRAVWSGGGRTWTLIASTGTAEARAVVGALPHDHAPGLLTRFGRGLRRLWHALSDAL